MAEEDEQQLDYEDEEYYEQEPVGVQDLLPGQEYDEEGGEGTEADVYDEGHQDGEEQGHDQGDAQEEYIEEEAEDDDGDDVLQDLEKGMCLPHDLAAATFHILKRCSCSCSQSRG